MDANTKVKPRHGRQVEFYNYYIEKYGIKFLDEILQFESYEWRKKCYPEMTNYQLGVIRSGVRNKLRGMEQRLKLEGVIR